MTIQGNTGEIQVGPSFAGTQPSTEQGVAHRGYVTSVRSDITADYTTAINTAKDELNNTISRINTRLISAETTISGHTADISTINTVLNTKAPLNAPVFIGTPQAATPNLTDNSQKLATTAYVQAIKAQVIAEIQNWAQNRDNEVRSEVIAQITPKAPLASPQLAGQPLTPTATANQSDQQIANTEFVTQAIINDEKWHGSKKFVSTETPDSATGVDGDFWFVVDQ